LRNRGITGVRAGVFDEAGFVALTVLDLYKNRLVEVRSVPATLVHLDLQHCEMGGAAVGSLAMALEVRGAQRTNLHFQQPPSRFVVCSLSPPQDVKNLQRLYINDNIVGGETGIHHHTTLKIQENFSSATFLTLALLCCPQCNSDCTPC
jgi:hypothetical protein